MVEKIEDLNLPIANVARIIKDSLPANASVSKEARQAIGNILKQNIPKLIDLLSQQEQPAFSSSSWRPRPPL